MTALAQIEDARGRYEARALPDVGDFNDEDCYNYDTDKFDGRKLKAECPSCGRVCCPLVSKRTRVIESGWRWVGCDHREPFADLAAVCTGCGKGYQLTIYTPQ